MAGAHVIQAVSWNVNNKMKFTYYILYTSQLLSVFTDHDADTCHQQQTYPLKNVTSNKHMETETYYDYELT